MFKPIIVRQKSMFLFIFIFIEKFSILFLISQFCISSHPPMVHLFKVFPFSSNKYFQAFFPFFFDSLHNTASTVCHKEKELLEKNLFKFFFMSHLRLTFLVPRSSFRFLFHYPLVWCGATTDLKSQHLTCNYWMSSIMVFYYNSKLIWNLTTLTSMELDNVVMMIDLLTFDFKFALFCAVMFLEINKKTDDASEKKSGYCSTSDTCCL